MKIDNARIGGLSLPILLVYLCLALVLGACQMAVPPTVPAGGETPTAVDATPLADVTPEPGTLDVIGTVLAADDLTTLASALVAADLADELNELGPFTLLAPTDAAFATLDPPLRDTILGSPEILADVLRYHLIVDDVTAAELATLGTAATALGETLTISLTHDVNLMINNANVVEADLVASNGRVHKINTVLLPSTLSAALLPTPTPAASPVTGTAATTVTQIVPVTVTTPVTVPAPITATAPVTTPAAITPVVVPVTDMSTMNLVEILNARPDLSTVATALAAAGLAEALTLPGPFTLLAPVNDAFAALPAETQDSVLNTGTARAALLQRHLIADQASAADLANLGSALTTSGETLTVTLGADGGVLVENAPIVESIQASNGIIHVLNTVLLGTAP
jgi:uncharacterized surface protein with fasciclin (FAS1) repeats